MMHKLAIMTVLMICIAATAGRSTRRTTSRDRGGSQQVVQEVVRTSNLHIDSVDDGSSRKGNKRRGLSSPSIGLGELIETAEPQAARGGKRRGKVQELRATAPLAGVDNLRRRDGLRNTQRALAQGATAEEGAVAESSIQASARNLDALQALLEKKQAKKERVDAREERKARKKDAARYAEGEKLKAKSEIGFETYDAGEMYSDTKAAASIDVGDNFAMQVVSNNQHKEDAVFEEKIGDKFHTGTRLRAHEFVDAIAHVDEEVLYENEETENQSLDAEGAFQDILVAKEEGRIENEEILDAHSLQKATRGFGQQSDFFGGRGFSNSPFGSLFKK